MKRILLLSLALATVVGCKSKVENPSYPDDEIRLGASTMLTKSVDAATTFGAGQEIGVYSIKQSNDAAFTDFAVKNAGYVYGSPVWGNKTEKLLWMVPDVALFMYGYHPFSGLTGSPVTASADALELTFNFPVTEDTKVIDQSDAALLTTYDLMYSKTSNDGAGFTKATQGVTPVNMKFGHKLCRLRFNLAVSYDNDITLNTDKIVTVKAVRVAGQQIMTQTKLNMKTGVASATVNPVGTSQTIEWKGAKNVVAVPSVNSGMTPPANFDAVADMIVIPFVAVQGDNTFTFELSYVNGSGQTKSNTYTINVPVYNGGNKDIDFVPNRYNDFKVWINLSTKNIELSASIVNWDTMVYDPIQAE